MYQLGSVGTYGGSVKATIQMICKYLASNLPYSSDDGTGDGIVE